MGRVLKVGAGTFWTVTQGGTVYLRSVARVAVALDVPALRAAYHASLAELRGPLAQVRARMAIRSIAAIRRGARISNATIADMLDISRRTVHLWKRLSGVRSCENFVIVGRLRRGQVARDFMGTGGPSLCSVGSGGRRWLARQLPSSFVAPDVRGVRVRLRRGNRRLRTLSAQSGGDTVRRCLHGDPHRRAAHPSPSLYTLLGRGERVGRTVRVWGVIPDNTGCKNVHVVARRRHRRMSPAGRRALHLLSTARQVFARRGSAR